MEQELKWEVADCRPTKEELQALLRDRAATPGAELVHLVPVEGRLLVVLRTSEPVGDDDPVDY